MSFGLIRPPSRLFRLCRSADPTKLTDWQHLARSEPGRWADPDAQYRVLYTADSEVGAYVEVLQDLRPRVQAVDIVECIEDDGEFGETLFSVEEAARERLRQYLIASLMTNVEDRIVECESSATRSEIEGRLFDEFGERRLKTGDCSSGDYKLTRRVSRLIYTSLDAEGRQFAGVVAASAEHQPTKCFAYFETGRETNELRGNLHVAHARQALDEESSLIDALDYLVPNTSAVET